MKPRIAVAALIASLAVLGIFALPAAAVAPVVSIEDATNVTYTTAKVKGNVNPEGQSTTWRLQYSTHADFSEDVTTVEGETTESVRPVEAELTGLTPGTTYYARLQAENGDGTVEDVTAPFETETVTKPTIENLEVSALTSDSAHFSALVTPNGGDTEWRFYCTPNPCGPVPSGTVSGAAGPETVERDPVGLEPNQDYVLHLEATNSAGGEEATVSFKPPASGPLVRAFAAGPVQSDRVKLNGEVNPRGSATTYWFEWGTADCGANPCQKLATHSAGEGPFYTWAEAQITDLTPETTYHFRLVAENALGTAEGDDGEFTTAAVEAPCTNQGMAGTGFLPNCRAYELVSPPDKRGLDVIPQTGKTHVAPDGNAVTFSSLGGFGEVHGTGTDLEYLSRRTGLPGTNGWSTAGINPPGSRASTFAAAGAGNTNSFVNGFSSDLSAGVYQAWQPLVSGSQVADVSNLYRVSPLGSGSPSVEMLTDANGFVIPLPETWFTLVQGRFAQEIVPYLVGASSDLSRVVFESRLDLTQDAPPYPTLPQSPCALGGLFCPVKLYENVGGAVRLAGRIPKEGETECDDRKGPACVPAATSEAALSAKEQKYSDFAVSADARRVYFVANGALYLREDGARTALVAAAGRFQAASADGSRAFFTTAESLLPADTDGGAEDLYMYDREAPPGSRLTLVSAGSPRLDGNVNAVIAASADGHSVYLTANAQLLAGEGPVGQGFYRWHDGRLSYIGSFSSTIEGGANGPAETSWGNSFLKSRVTPDGHTVMFMSLGGGGLIGRGGFAGYDQTEHEEFYLYDARTGRLVCASCNPSGKPATESATIQVRENAAASLGTSDYAQALTDDGRYAFFNSKEGLVPEDTNGTWDAYEYDSRTETLHLLSSGTDEAPSYFLDASPDGHDVYIVTRQQLVGWDRDASYDLYDTRVGGGFPEPEPAPAPCSGDSCLPGTPALAPAPTTSSEAPSLGNPKPPRHCPKGTKRVKRHGRFHCQRRRHHRKSRHHQKDRASNRAPISTDRRQSR